MIAKPPECCYNIIHKRIKVKKIKRRYFFLLVFFVFSSCATRPAPQIIIEEIEKQPQQPEIIHIEIMSPPLTAVEKMLLLVKQNGTDIKKYFFLEENSRIIVKADLQDDTGIYEVIYDLENVKHLENSVYEVTFILHEKKTDKYYEDTLIWAPRPGTAGILLSFDDDYVIAWEQYLDLFDKYEARVTFFMQGEFDPFSLKALERGHDIGFHSISHPDLRRISRSDFFKETIEGAQLFRKEGVPVSSFAFPFGFSEPWMYEVLFPSFDVLRGYGVTFRIYNLYEIKSAFISSRAVDNTVIRSDENFDRIIISMLRTVKFMDGNWVLPLTTHDISDAAWAITPRRLEFLLSMTAELGLKFYRFSDISDLHQQRSPQQ